MECCQCQGIENMFDEKTAKRELERYNKKGPHKATQLLLDAIHKINIKGLSFLDIGGGIGIIQRDLFKEGVSNGISIEASKAYYDVAREEATRNGFFEKVNFRHGDFTSIASQSDAADIVTLDKVICCYDDLSSLVGLSSKLARKIYAIVYFRDVWWTKIMVPFLNLYPKIKGSSFRAFIHPTKKVEKIIFKNGFKRFYYSTTFIWQVAVFTR